MNKKAAICFSYCIITLGILFQAHTTHGMVDDELDSLSDSEKDDYTIVDQKQIASMKDGCGEIKSSTQQTAGSSLSRLVDPYVMERIRSILPTGHDIQRIGSKCVNVLCLDPIASISQRMEDQRRMAYWQELDRQRKRR